MGMVNFYRRLVPRIANVAQPITNLKRADVKVNWTPECQAAFEEIQKILTKEPILKQPDFNKVFIFICDASDIGLGAILAQLTEEGLEAVIAYASRLLKGSEIHYRLNSSALRLFLHEDSTFMALNSV